MPWLSFRQKPFNTFEQPNQATNTPQLAAPTVFAVQFGFRGAGSVPRGAAHPDTNFQATNAALAAAGSLTFVTVPAGDVFLCAHLELSVSVAGSYQITNQGTVQWDLDMLALTPTVLINCFPGIFLYPGSGILAVKNNTAGAAAVKVTAWGRIVLA